MTISAETAVAGPYSGNGATTAFAFSFKCFSTSDVDVYLETSAGAQTLQTLSTHYSVSLNADQDTSPGGTVTMVTAPVTGSKLHIVSGLPLTRTDVFSNAGGFYPNVLNDARDKTTLQIIQINDRVSRSIRGPIGETVSSELPNAATRAGKYLAFDDSGNPTAVSALTGVTLGAGWEDALADPLLSSEQWLVVDTHSELKNLTGTSAEDVVLMLGSRGGFFTWITGDQSTNVTNDAGEGVWVPPASDPTGASGCWKRYFTGDVHLNWFDTVGDGSTDDTTAVQNAMDYMEYIGQQETDSRSLFVPLGKYKLTSTITVTEGFAIRGEGVTMFRDRPFSSDLVEAGSWFYIAHTGKGVSFGGQGATLVRGTGTISGLGTYRDQPTPAASWAPTAHDYDFYIDDGSWDFHHIGMLNPTKGICVDGVSGRCNFRNIRMDAFDVGIEVLRATDVIRIDGLHIWPFWYDDNIDSVTYIQDYKFANLIAIQTARCDLPDFKSIFAIYANSVWKSVETADGQASGVKLTNVNADNCKYLVNIDSTNTTALVTAQLVNVRYSGFSGGSGTEAIYVNGLAYLQICNAWFRRCDKSFVDLVSGATSYISLVNIHGEDWNNSGGGWPALRCVPSGAVIELVSQPDFSSGNSGPLYGGASGEFIIPDVQGYEAGVSSDGSGDITVTHDMGIAPNVMIAQIRNNANISVKCTSPTSTQFTARLYDADAGTVLASTAVNLMWTVKY